MDYSEINNISNILSYLRRDIDIIKYYKQHDKSYVGITLTQKELEGIEDEFISLLEKQIVKYDEQLMKEFIEQQFQIMIMILLFLTNYGVYMRTYEFII